MIRQDGDQVGGCCQFRLVEHLDRAVERQIRGDMLVRQPVRDLERGSPRLREQQVLSAASALVRGGTPPEEITSLASLVTVPAFKVIMIQRLQKHDGKPNAYEHGLAKALVAIADEWVRPGEAHI